MRTFAILLGLCLAIQYSLAAGDHDVDWCYKNPACDAKHWTAGDCSTGSVQSPIDFDDKTMKINKTAIRLRFNAPYFNVQPKFTIANNGHSVQVSLPKDSPSLVLDGDGLNGSYVFAQLHFHWGSKNDQGSEHTVNGKSFPIELHLVHYNSMYKSLGDAVNVKNHRALLVLGMFFSVSSEDNWALKPIVDSLNGVQNHPDPEGVESNRRLNISSFLPNNLALYRYYGSLTTPGCLEIVHWNVLQTPVPISQSQLNAFRMVQDSHGDRMVDNYRPTLPLAGRQVVKYMNVDLERKVDNQIDHHPLMPDNDYDSLTADKKTPAKKSGATLPTLLSPLILVTSMVVVWLSRTN